MMNYIWIALIACSALVATFTGKMQAVSQASFEAARGAVMLAIGLIGITGSVGKFFFGWLSDRIKDAKYSAALGFLFMAMGMFLLYRADNVIVLYAFALIYGFGYGSLAPVTPVTDT